MLRHPGDYSRMMFIPEIEPITNKVSQSGDSTGGNWAQPDARLALEAIWQLCANGPGSIGDPSLRKSCRCLNRTYPRLVSSNRGENFSVTCNACGPGAPQSAGPFPSTEEMLREDRER